MLPSTAPVPTPARISPLRTAPHHPRTSSAEVLLFWCFPSVNPSWWQTGKGWKRVLGGGQLPMQRVRLLMRHTSLQLHTDGTFPSPVWCTSLAPLVYHARYEFRCCCLNWSPFFEWSHITPYLPDSIGPWCLVHTCLGNRHYTVHSKDGAVTDGRDIIMQPRIIGPMWRLCHKVHKKSKKMGISPTPASLSTKKCHYQHRIEDLQTTNWSGRDSGSITWHGCSLGCQIQKKAIVCIFDHALYGKVT